MNPEPSIGKLPELTVALFPLPGLVFFPQAVLPLHIFEERYREMTADALAGSRLIAMALLKPGWQKDYYQSPAIEPVICVGRILNNEQLPDGKYNLLLQGELRAEIVQEIQKRPYRIAKVRALRQIPATEIDLENHRRKLAEIIGSISAANTTLARHIRKIVQSPLGMAEIADLLAFNFLEDIELKQSLLAEPDTAKRVARVVSEIESLLPGLLGPGAIGNRTIGLN
jgi:uncharacterized protein